MRDVFCRYQILVYLLYFSSFFPFSTALAGEIQLGMSTALTGPASALGQGILFGAQAYFTAVNTNGGIHNNQIHILPLDDGYEPTRTKPNMVALLQDKETLAIIGNVGTPPAMVSVPLANSEKTLLFGAYTGAGILRQSPPDRYVINYRASYAEETAVMIKGLLQAAIKPAEIAFFTQDDGYGQAGYEGAVLALKQSGFHDVDSLIHTRYKRNTAEISDAVDDILRHNKTTKAVIMVGTYTACAAFIRKIKPFLPNCYFLNVSFVGSRALLTQLGPDAEGVIVTQVVPDPWGDLPLVKQYRHDLTSLNPTFVPDFVSLEGYIIARIICEGLIRAGKTPNRESIISALESINNLDIGLGQTISFNSEDHQASHKVWPTIINQGQYESLDWNTLTGGLVW